MRMSLADVKKRIVRRDDGQVLTPYLLRRSDLVREMEALIALYEASVGSAHGSIPAGSARRTDRRLSAGTRADDLPGRVVRVAGDRLAGSSVGE